MKQFSLILENFSLSDNSITGGPKLFLDIVISETIDTITGKIRAFKCKNADRTPITG